MESILFKLVSSLSIKQFISKIEEIEKSIEGKTDAETVSKRRIINKAIEELIKTIEKS